jgi:endonuclease YncB( thermonuclease family)
MTSRDRFVRSSLVLAVLGAALLFAGTALAEGTFFKKKRAAPAVQQPTPPPPAPAPTPQPAPAPEPQDSGTAQPPVEQTTSPTPEPAPQPPTPAPVLRAVSGNVDSVDSTDTLIVAGQRVRLLGVDGTGGSAEGLKRWIVGNGNQLNCEPVGPRYKCQNPRGADVAQIVLFNGAGRADASATPEYRAAEAQARAQRKGIWAQQ